MDTNNVAVLGTSIAVHLALTCLALLAISPVGLGLHPILGGIFLLCGVGIASYLNCRYRKHVVHWLWFTGPILTGLALTVVTLIVVYRLAFPPSVVSFDGFISFTGRMLTDVHEVVALVSAWLGMTLALCIASFAGAAVGRLSVKKLQHGDAR